MAWRQIEVLLKPDGKVIGTQKHPKSAVRWVYVAAPKQGARDLFSQLASLGYEAETGDPTRGSRPGLLVEIPALGYVGYREAPTPTVDVNVSIEGLRNVKFKFVSDSGRESL